jgi:heme a synthase
MRERAAMNAASKPLSPWIGRWLVLIALMVFAMVVVGGATRLTGSGLSITEWKPIMGAIPPLTDADWQAAFAKYQQSSQYQLQNQGMSLEGFKFIFWWEWAHRLLGRLIGIVVFVPLLWFWVRKQLSSDLCGKLLIMFVLGALQGALGWYMVASGLVDRVSVSQYRLAAHLTLATFIFAYVMWVRFGLGASHQWPSRGIQWLATALLGLVFVQIAAGGFVAGLDAGQGYNTWPLMGGAIIPNGLDAIEPWWHNLFENALTVQFDHRMLAYGILLLAIIQLVRAPGNSSALLVAAVLLQAVLGVTTLLLHVPLALALMHQAGALVVLTAAVWNLHRKTQI